MGCGFYAMQDNVSQRMWHAIWHPVCGIDKKGQKGNNWYVSECLTLAFHISGTMLLNRLLAISSSSDDITTKPFRAFTISLRVWEMTASSLLNLKDTKHTRTSYWSTNYLNWTNLRLQSSMDSSLLLNNYKNMCTTCVYSFDQVWSQIHNKSNTVIKGQS